MHGLIFDKDGTLLDFRASWSEMLRELSLELCEGDGVAAEAMLVAAGMDPETGHCASGSVLAAGNTVDLARLWFPAHSEDLHEALVERLNGTFYVNGIKGSVLLPGVREVLAELSAIGYAMGVATNDGTAGARAALAALGLGTHLPHVFGYDAVERPKPAPDSVHAFAAATGLPVSAIVVIGDNRHDLEMARSAGAGAAIGVLSGNSGVDDLAPLADTVLESVCDLPIWLRAQA